MIINWYMNSSINLFNGIKINVANKATITWRVLGLPDPIPLVLMAEITRESDHSHWFSAYILSLSVSHLIRFLHFSILILRAMDTEFLRTLDRQILLGVFVAFVAAGAGAAYYLSSSKKRRGSISNPNSLIRFVFWVSRHNAYLTI